MKIHYIMQPPLLLWVIAAILVIIDFFVPNNHAAIFGAVVILLGIPLFFINRRLNKNDNPGYIEDQLKQAEQNYKKNKKVQHYSDEQDYIKESKHLY